MNSFWDGNKSYFEEFLRKSPQILRIHDFSATQTVTEFLSFFESEMWNISETEDQKKFTIIYHFTVSKALNAWLDHLNINKRSPSC